MGKSKPENDEEEVEVEEDEEEEQENQDDEEEQEEGGGGNEDDESEYDEEGEEDEEGEKKKQKLEVNQETITIPEIKSKAKALAVAKLIKDSPKTTGVVFDAYSSGRSPSKHIVEALCKHGNLTSFELKSGDWEAYLSRFPKILLANPNLKRVVLSDAQQSGCKGFIPLMQACLQLPHLEYLDCSENYDEMGIAKYLAQLIAENKNLKTMNMAENDFDEKHEKLLVSAIKKAAEEKRLGLENLEGIDLNEEQWREMLGLPEEPKFEEMSNDDILTYLRDRKVCEIIFMNF